MSIGFSLTNDVIAMYWGLFPLQHYSCINLVFYKFFRFKSSQINKQVYFVLKRNEININFHVSCLQTVLVCYSQTHSSVTTRQSFWHLFDKFLISLIASGLKRANQIFRTSADKRWKALHICLSNFKVGSGRDFEKTLTKAPGGTPTYQL